MKKHNETRSKKILVQKNGKVIRKAISFAIVFVMLFCISAIAFEEERYNQTLTVRTISESNQNFQTKSINVNVWYAENETEYGYGNAKEIPIEKEFGVLQIGYGIYYEDKIIAIYGIGYYSNSANGEITENGVREECNIPIITQEEWQEYDLQEIRLISVEQTLEGINETNVVPANIDEVIEHLSIIENYGQQIKTRTDYTENIILIEESPAYEGFIGNARGLFDMIFESMQSIFNWLVSPNVIVFFGLGIILSISTIGILIARRFFWGR